MKFLVTGGFGYLGGRLASMLAAEGHEIVLGTRRLAVAPAWAPNAMVATIDWSRYTDLERACDGADVVVHLAGTNAHSSATNPAYAMEFNGGCTATLVKAAEARGVRRFVYLSTAHVYGAALVGTIDEETTPLPIHPHASSHHAGERAVAIADAAGNISGVILRLSNAFGAPIDPSVDCWMLVANDLCRQAVCTRRMVLRTAGTQRRDFIAVQDASRAILHLSTARLSANTGIVFNVGGAWAPALTEMAELIASRVEVSLGFTPTLERGALRDAVGDRPMEYRIDRLLASGFTPGPSAAVAEVDRLVGFCTRYWRAAS